MVEGRCRGCAEIGGVVKRSARATATRTLRRALTWQPKRRGAEALSVPELISPLRYDVLVRAQFFEFLTHRPAGETADRLVAAALEEPYAVWFREVAMARFRPWVLKDPVALRSNYAERVLSSRDLLKSFNTNGFDAKTPVTLRLTSGVRTSDTGARVSRTVHVGDGGHRLALLLQSGSDLLPHMYRLDPRPMPLIDNTAVLLAPLGISEADYCSFVEAGYGRHGFSDVQSLLAAVSVDDAEAGAELRSVLEAHARSPRPVV
jgi:hypothetical protein